MIFIYNLLFSIVFILYFPILLVRGKVHAGFLQRLGFFSQELAYRLSQKPNIWFHAVSVGEVLAIAELVEQVRAQNPEHRIVVSTVTPTGHKLAQKRFKKEDVVIFAPLDFGFSAKTFIRIIKPEIYIIAETELWPHLSSCLVRKDVPIVVVNGRVAERSFYRYLRFRFFWQKILKSFRAFCMQTELDADRVIKLGALPKRVLVSGSMKFDEALSAEAFDRNRLALSENAIVWVAGSTHPGEEKIILEIYKKLKSDFPSLRLVLAPRHIERTDELTQLIKAEGLNTVRFSQVGTKPSQDPVIVVDTIGHLKAIYSVSDIVFVGKSLVGHGGQNVIEPAFFAKPVITGPHTENFKNIVNIFLENRGLVQVEDKEGLQNTMVKLLRDPKLRQSLGERALATIRRQQGATKANAKVICDILSTTRFIKLI